MKHKVQWGVAVMAAAAGLALLAGCEQRVVAARGLGADQYQIQEPMYDPPEWEKAILGDPNPRRRDVIQPPKAAD